MNLNRFTQKSIDAISEAQQMAQEAEHPQVTPEHLLKALLQQEDGLVPQVIKKMGADVIIKVSDVDPVKYIMDDTAGVGVDVVLDMVGNQQAIDWGLKLVKKAGTYTAFGIPPSVPKLDLAAGSSSRDRRSSGSTAERCGKPGIRLQIF